ncbi:hypothetical protein AMTRI_Chr01g109480 [Amborella trichopoda]
MSFTLHLFHLFAFLLTLFRDAMDLLVLGIFLVKTYKRILFAEVRSYDKALSINYYLLLFAALAQFPLFFWLGYLGA